VIVSRDIPYYIVIRSYKFKFPMIAFSYNISDISDILQQTHTHTQTHAHTHARTHARTRTHAQCFNIKNFNN